jgi:hypothetical protein
MIALNARNFKSGICACVPRFAHASRLERFGAGHGITQTSPKSRPFAVNLPP